MPKVFLMRGLVFVFLGVCFVPSFAVAFGLTADQMYRNLLITENGGSLPSYYPAGRKNAGNVSLPFKKQESESEKIWKESNASFSEPVETDIFQAGNKEEWKDVVLSVKNGRTTPFDLETIRRRSTADDAEAVELLAWMYATGNGVRRNLTKSWTYYLQAAHLGVPSATENAQAVYKAMNTEERSHLPAL